MTSVSWSSTPQSPLGDNSVRPVGSDPLVALGRQVREIIENLSLIPATRKVRAEEALHVLQNTLFHHSEQICESEQVQLDIFRALDEVFNSSVERGCKAFHVIFDFKWKDQHEKRSRCLDLLLRQALKSTNGEMCDQIIKCIVEVLNDNIRTTSDVLEDNFTFLLNARKESADVLLHTAVYKVLSAFVTTTFGIIRRNPALVESLNKSLPIVSLTKHNIFGSYLSLTNAVANTNSWSDTSVNSGRSSSVSASSSVDANNHNITITTSFDTSHGKLTTMELNLLRTSELELINVMLNHNCYELTLESIMQVVNIIRTAMEDVCSEEEIVGLLHVMITVVTSPLTVSSSILNVDGMANYLVHHQWHSSTVSTRCLVIQAMCRVYMFMEALNKTTHTVEYQDNQEVPHVTTTATTRGVIEPSASSFSPSEALEPQLHRIYSDSQISIPPEESIINNNHNNNCNVHICKKEQQPLLSQELLPKEKKEEEEQFKERENQHQQHKECQEEKYQEKLEEEFNEKTTECEEEAFLVDELRVKMLEFVVHEQNIDVIRCGVKCIIELLGANDIITIDDVPAIVSVLQNVLVKHEYILDVFEAFALIELKFGNDALTPLWSYVKEKLNILAMESEENTQTKQIYHKDNNINNNNNNNNNSSMSSSKSITTASTFLHDLQKMNALVQLIPPFSLVVQCTNLVNKVLDNLSNSSNNDIVNALALVNSIQYVSAIDTAAELLTHSEMQVRNAAACTLCTLCGNCVKHEVHQSAHDYIYNQISKKNKNLNGMITSNKTGTNVATCGAASSSSAPHFMTLSDEHLQALTNCLLDAAVTDRCHTVRETILTRLPLALDRQICSSTNLEALSMLLNDTVPSVREAALIILCRLLPSYPTQIHPLLSTLESAALEEVNLRTATLSRMLDKCQILKVCAARSALTMQPCDVEQVIWRNLHERPFISKQLLLANLHVLETTLQHSEPAHHCEPTQLIEPVLLIISNSDSTDCRTAGLMTLCAILTALLVQDSNLIHAIYRVIARIIRWEAKEEDRVTIAAMRVVGTLGAISPVKIRYVLRALESDEVEEEEEVVTPAMTHCKPHLRINPNLANRYPSAVLYYLIKALQLTIDARLQVEALTTLRVMLRSVPAKQRLDLFTQILPQLRSWLQEPSKFHLYEKVLLILIDLTVLLRQFSDDMRLSKGLEVMQSANLFCKSPQASQKPFNALVVQLLDVLAKCLPPQELRNHRWAVEFIHHGLSQNETDLDLILRTVESLESFLSVMHEIDVQIILPHVLQRIEPVYVDDVERHVKVKDVNEACFDFLNCVIAENLPVMRDCCANVINTILNYVEQTNNREEIESALTTLALLVHTVGSPAQRFTSLIANLLSSKSYPATYLSDLLQTVSIGNKSSAMLSSSHSSSPITQERPITLISHLPSLSEQEVKREVCAVLKIDPREITFEEINRKSGQTVMTFTLAPNMVKQSNFNTFLRRGNDVSSSLRRNLGIFNIEQGMECTPKIDRAIFASIANTPGAKSRKREQSWISWLHNTTVRLLQQSPYTTLRCTASAADRNNELAIDLFPFAAAAIAANVDALDRKYMMDVFNEALQKAPVDINQILFTLAEFMEAERVQPKEVTVRVNKETTFIVERKSVEQKFGISYDQDPHRGVIVTKLAPNGLGMQAGVPVGAQLLYINNQPVRSVSDIRGMIDGAKRLELRVAYVVEVKQRIEPKAVMNIDILARVAFQSQMHAKAIYFNEVLFNELQPLIEEGMSRKNTILHKAITSAERLIEFYGHLNMNMEASGLVTVLHKKFENLVAPERFGFDEVGTLEQLHWWEEALSRYEATLMSEDCNHLNISSFIGALRCHEALGHTDVMKEMIEHCWSELDSVAKEEVVSYRAKVAFNMGEWMEFDSMAENQHFVEHFDVVERCAAHFRLSKYDELLHFTQQRREMLLEPFAESFNESYSRSYETLIELQHLTHFEELVDYVDASVERKKMLKKLWYTRLVNLSSKPVNLQTVVAINSLVLSPLEDLHSQVYAIRSLTKMQWFSAAEFMLSSLLGHDVTMDVMCEQPPELIHAYVKYLHARGNVLDTYDLLHGILKHVHVTPQDRNADAWGWCWIVLGELTLSLHPDHGDEAIEPLMRAAELSSHNSTAFHSLGILHYDLARLPTTNSASRIDHCIAAAIAFFKSVQLCSDRNNDMMQDVVRILSIWFAHYQTEELNNAIRDGVHLLASHVWLDVIPQLIARIGITGIQARNILAQLLVSVGRIYPHALIYPLTVAEKSPDMTRALMAKQVLSGIRKENAQIVEEASLISNEMVRIAILWSEKWHAAIHDAAQRHDNAAAVLKILKPLYDELAGAGTPNERAFEKLFGVSLRRARDALNERAIDHAWSYLKPVYVQLDKMLNERRFNMREISPTLESVEHSIVAVPGTFEHNKPCITVERFRANVYIMPSKQKPRRFGLDGSDGKTYHFLLKGHEDMRQDERVMQFIKLVNNVFASENATSAIGLNIPQYAVIPLSENVGIVGWVENTETIYRMLESFRRENGTSIYEEVNMILKNGGLENIEQYHRLNKEQRKSLLEMVNKSTPDDELSRIMWQNNDACEQWLSYRSNYGHTLAAMSMVGYVLGLGDRHLNNLMLAETGLVVHIDFGDCFEVAMLRALYAEAVPFRLTRLLVRALGITGVDGVFRLTSELVMKNLRKYSENLLSLLEAFIYDPLINWRLTSNDHDRSTSTHEDYKTESTPAEVNANENTNTERSNQTSNNANVDFITHDNNMKITNMLADVVQHHIDAHMQLSHSYAKQYLPTESVTISDEGESGEIRNEQGDLALARVKAKLAGQEFEPVNGSFAALRSTRQLDNTSRTEYMWGVNHDVAFGNSPKESIDATLLTTYLSTIINNQETHTYDVSRQVDKLIQEATSLDNLADAYLTGWAPFW